MRVSLRSVLYGLVLLALGLVPVYAELFDDPFTVSLVSRMMALAIAAVSLNLIMGYGGMISFGHAAFIGIGAYTVGIATYYDVYSGWLQLPLAILFSALFALVTGAICLRTRGVYFIMITLAFTQMIYFAFVSLDEYGGDDGLVVMSRSRFGSWLPLTDNTWLYYAIFVLLLAALIVVHRLVNSRFGMVVRGARSNERRMEAIGFPVFRYRLTCYVVAGVMCGIAGVLLGNFAGFVSPAMMHWTRSGELIFMVVFGGMGSLFGPVVGAAAFLLLEEILKGFTTYWQIIFGPLLVLVVLFARGGVDGLLSGRRQADD